MLDRRPRLGRTRSRPGAIAPAAEAAVDCLRHLRRGWKPRLSKPCSFKAVLFQSRALSNRAFSKTKSKLKFSGKSQVDPRIEEPERPISSRRPGGLEPLRLWRYGWRESCHSCAREGGTLPSGGYRGLPETGG